MLGGEFRHGLDPKNRIFIPAKMRDELGSTFVVAKNIREKCIRVYSLTQWDEYIKPLTEQARKLGERILRYLSSTSAEVTPDSQGRIVLPKELISYAEIDKNVVVVGCYDCAEIWAEDVYEKMKSEENPDALLAELESLGL